MTTAHSQTTRSPMISVVTGKSWMVHVGFTIVLERFDGGGEGAIMLCMLDTQALRLDICSLIRAARSRPSRRACLLGRRVQLDELNDALLFLDDDLAVDLVRVRVRVPVTGKAARGPGSRCMSPVVI